MWWKILSTILSKNNSPAWNRIGSLINTINKFTPYQNSAKTTYQGTVDNSGMYGAWNRYGF